MENTQTKYDMKIVHVDVIKEAQTLFELEKLAFHRDFDLSSRNIQELRDYLEKSETYILYADQKPQGFFAFKKTNNEIELLSIAVNPDKQGKGYGRVMMNKIIELAKGDSIQVVTHPKNRSAIIFYLKSGFEIYGWKDNYYGDGKPRLLLKRL